MMDIYIMQYNYGNRYLVVIDGDVYVYKYNRYKFDSPFLCFKPKHVFIGKSKVCEMTNFSGAVNRDFDGNTLLLEVEDGKYIYISGLEIIEFRTDDKILDYISLMGNIMIPYAIMLGEKFTYFLNQRYKNLENNKTDEGTLLKATNNSLDPNDYHLEKCGEDSYKKTEYSLIHTCWPGQGDNGEDENDILGVENEDGEDENVEGEVLIETQYLNGNKEVVKIFNQKRVICLERDSIYAFRRCGHQCICEECYQKKVILFF